MVLFDVVLMSLKRPVARRHGVVQLLLQRDGALLRLRVDEPLLSPGLRPVGLDLVDVQDALAIRARAVLGAVVGDDVGLVPVGAAKAGRRADLVHHKGASKIRVRVAPPHRGFRILAGRILDRAPLAKPVSKREAPHGRRQLQLRLGVVGAAREGVLAELWLCFRRLHHTGVQIAAHAVDLQVAIVETLRLLGVCVPVVLDELGVIPIGLRRCALCVVILIANARRKGTICRLRQLQPVVGQELDHVVLGELRVGLLAQHVGEARGLQLGRLHALLLQHVHPLLWRAGLHLGALGLLQRLAEEAQLVEGAGGGLKSSGHQRAPSSRA